MCGHPKAWIFNSKIREHTLCRYCGTQYPPPAVSPVVSNVDSIWKNGPKSYLQAAQLGQAKEKLEAAKKSNQAAVVQALEELYPELKLPEPKVLSPYQMLQTATAKAMAATKQVELKVQHTVDLGKKLDAARLAAAEAVAAQSLADKELAEARRVHSAQRGLAPEPSDGDKGDDVGNIAFVDNLESYWDAMQLQDNQELAAMFATLKAAMSEFKGATDKIRKENRTRKDGGEQSGPQFKKPKPDGEQPTKEDVPMDGGGAEGGVPKAPKACASGAPAAVIPPTPAPEGGAGPSGSGASSDDAANAEAFKRELAAATQSAALAKEQPPSGQQS